MYLDNVLPAIMAEWRGGLPATIVLQHDNAPAHVNALQGSEWEAACSTHGLNISVHAQPPNSPDLNVLDLGLFRAIQCHQWKREGEKTKEGLLRDVTWAFWNQAMDTLGDIFISLQSIFLNVMKFGGDNTFKEGHLGKARLKRLGLLEERLSVPENLVQSASSTLAAMSTERVGEETRSDVGSSAQHALLNSGNQRSSFTEMLTTQLSVPGE